MERTPHGRRPRGALIAMTRPVKSDRTGGGVPKYWAGSGAVGEVRLTAPAGAGSRVKARPVCLR